MNESDGSYSLICPMYCWYPFMNMDHLWSFECGTSLNWTCTETASDLLVVQRDCTWKRQRASQNMFIHEWFISNNEIDISIHTQLYIHIYIYTYIWHIHDFSQAKASKEQAKRLPLVTLPRSGFVFGIHPNDENQNPRPAQHQFFAPEIKSVKSGTFSYWNL